MAKNATIGARELKTRLGTYLRKVRQGSTLVITDRGEPIAELRPIPTPNRGIDAALARLAATGAITRLETRGLSAFRQVVGRGLSLSEAVVEDREDRF